jgi:hypothetical protein
LGLVLRNWHDQKRKTLVSTWAIYFIDLCCPVYKSGWREWLMFQAGFLWNVKMTWGTRHNSDNNSQHFRERPLMAHDKQAFSWKK